jgi:ABC-type dipeptide/oligopeptide/nickel transport system ATPase component
MEKEVLKIQKDTAFGVYNIEDAYENDWSSHQYNQAINIFKQILDIQEKARAEYADKESIQAQAYCFHSNFNNILAFVGDRGTGKTSTMSNFAKLLTNKNEKVFADPVKSTYESFFMHKKYHVLDIIDPSIFENEDSIVDVIIAEMFHVFRQKEDVGTFAAKKEVVHNFEKVYADLRELAASPKERYKENVDNLEVVSSLAQAMNLQNDLFKLITSFLKYINQNGDDYFLIIPIDDIDMNINGANKLLEDLRKYLFIPNVIILFAINDEQMNQLIMQNNIRQYDSYINYINQSTNIQEKSQLNSELKKKTEKYMEKIIPYNRKIYMRQIHPNIMVELAGNKAETLYSVTTNLFYEKLGYCIATERHFKHIIPENLRGIVDFLLTLYEMNGEETHHQHNIQTMITYYLSYAKDNLSNYSDIKILKEIGFGDADSINRKLFIHLCEKLGDKVDNNDNNDNNEYYILKMLDLKNKVCDARVTYGDIISIYYTATKYLKNETKFLELIKLFYSLRLLKLKSEHAYAEIFYNLLGNDWLGHIFNDVYNYNTFIEEINLGIDIVLPELSINKITLPPSFYNYVIEEEGKLKLRKANALAQRNGVPTSFQAVQNILEILENEELNFRNENENITEFIEEWNHIYEGLVCFYSLLQQREKDPVKRLTSWNIEQPYMLTGKEIIINFTYSPFHIINYYFSDFYLEEQYTKDVSGDAFLLEQPRLLECIINMDVYFEFIGILRRRIRNKRFESKDYISRLQSTLGLLNDSFNEAYSQFPSVLRPKIHLEVPVHVLNFVQVNMDFNLKKLNFTKQVNEQLNKLMKVRTTIEQAPPTTEKEKYIADRKLAYNYINSTASRYSRNYQQGMKINIPAIIKTLKKKFDELMKYVTAIDKKEMLEYEISDYFKIITNDHNINQDGTNFGEEQIFGELGRKIIRMFDEATSQLVE